MGEADALLESLINIETGQRGFALSARITRWNRWSRGQRGFAEHLQRFGPTADNPPSCTG